MDNDAPQFWCGRLPSLSEYVVENATSLELRLQTCQSLQGRFICPVTFVLVHRKRRTPDIQARRYRAVQVRSTRPGPSAMSATAGWWLLVAFISRYAV